MSSLNVNSDLNCGAQSTSFDIQMFVYAVEWLLHISSTINHQSRICARSLGQHKYDWNLWVCTARNKSLLEGILKISIFNNSSSQADLTSGLV